MLVPLLASLSLLAPAGASPIGFVENGGQAAGEVRFETRVGGVPAWFDDHGATFAVGGPGGGLVAIALQHPGLAADGVAGEGPRPGRVNYLRGADPDGWAIDLAHFEVIRYRGVAPDVDLVYRHGDVLEFDLELGPAADLARLEFRVVGATDLAIDAGGRLSIATAAGPLRMSPPRCYDAGPGGERRGVRGSFRRLASDRFGFTLPPGRPGGRRVIDPGLKFSTYVGGVLFDEVEGITLIGDDLFVAGTTNSASFPITAGALDPVFGGIFSDGFVMRMDAESGALVYATFLGGSGTDGASDVAVDPSLRATVVGRTQSFDFPVTPGAFAGLIAGGVDGFVARINPAGNGLVFSTYLGGAASDEVLAVDLANDGDILLTGFTGSADFPVTIGSYDNSFNGGGPFLTDAFVTSLAATGQSLRFSTYLGGADVEEGRGISALGDDLVVVGRTDALDFPATLGAFDSSFGGGLNDGFVARIDGAVGGLTWASFVGGDEGDVAEAVDVDDQGRSFLTGRSASNDLGIAGGFDQFQNGGDDAYLLVLEPDGATQTFGTYLGGSTDEAGLDVVVDAAGAAYLTGYTDSLDFPALLQSYDSTANGGVDGFFTKVKPLGAGLNESSYVGGGSFDEGRTLAVDTIGTGYVGGRTSSSGFPVTAGSIQTSLAGSADGFVIALPSQVCSNEPNAQTYGNGKAGSGGVPMLTTENEPVVPSQDFQLKISNALPGAVPFLFVGLAPAALPFDGGNLLVSPFLVLTLPPLSGLGRLTLPVPVESDASLCALTLYVQVMYYDPGAPTALYTAQTHGVSMHFGS